MDNLSETHWKRHARQWMLIGRPLRPGPEDLKFSRSAMEEALHSTNHHLPTLLVLGVTPELCRLPPATSRAIAVDRSGEMISALWTGRDNSSDEVLCADWRSIPLPDEFVDYALGDGSFNVLPFPSGYIEVCAELRRLLRPGGGFAIRCFAQLDKPETIEQVFFDLAHRRITNFHILKWRLAMALQPAVEAGVCVGDVWSALNARWPGLDLLAREFNWPFAEVRTVESYRDSDVRYTFPTLAECREFFPAAGFAIERVSIPAYELGERCPTLVLKKV